MDRTFIFDSIVRIDKFGKKKLSIMGYYAKPIVGIAKQCQLKLSFVTKRSDVCFHATITHNDSKQNFTSRQFIG